ncbi:M15 family metallopeptidase [Actinocorallia lasiicapitis]
MDEILLMSDARVADVPVGESTEPLVDVRELGLLLDHRKSGDGASYPLLRSGVAERLVQAESLLPDGTRFLLVEGHRPLALQTRYFEEYAKDLRIAHPEWPAAHVQRMASRYVAPPEVAPHSTGAAVDLTLATGDGTELDLGSEVNGYDDAGAPSLAYTDATGLPAEAAHHRGVLVKALSEAGFVNYPTEFWHWSFGDRYWAAVRGEPALYPALA